jgi:uncharacterized membrane protein YedE/YeeE
VKSRLCGAIIGVVFGATLCWSGMSNPDVIRGALLLQHSYLFLVFGSGVIVAAVGTELLRRRSPRALLADTPVAFSRERPARRHIAGSLMFGVGWAVADVCPGPIATQIGQGIPWAVFPLVGLLVGVLVFLRRARVGETEPAVDRVPSPAPARAEGRSYQPVAG